MLPFLKPCAINTAKNYAALTSCWLSATTKAPASAGEQDRCGGDDVEGGGSRDMDIPDKMSLNE